VVKLEATNRHAGQLAGARAQFQYAPQRPIKLDVANWIGRGPWVFRRPGRYTRNKFPLKSQRPGDLASTFAAVACACITKASARKCPLHDDPTVLPGWKHPGAGASGVCAREPGSVHATGNTSPTRQHRGSPAATISLQTFEVASYNVLVGRLGPLLD
jgi:hypothetical protein